MMIFYVVILAVVAGCQSEKEQPVAPVEATLADEPRVA